jgi:hypothetical protein
LPKYKALDSCFLEDLIVQNLIMQWSQCKKSFEFDGSWRDIYVLKTNSIDWNRLLDALTNSKYEMKFWVDNERVQPIKTIQELLEIPTRSSPLMHIDISDVNIACHFFTDENIEFDIDPREVVNQENLDGILMFITFIGNLLQKQVVLTPENLENILLITFFPETQTITHHNENET